MGFRAQGVTSGLGVEDFSLGAYGSGPGCGVSPPGLESRILGLGLGVQELGHLQTKSSATHGSWICDQMFLSVIHREEMHVPFSSKQAAYNICRGR